jgi:hypothetical protein
MILEALELIATPMRPDGTWNRDREACRQLARRALDAAKDGQDVPEELITEALRVTGDSQSTFGGKK